MKQPTMILKQCDKIFISFLLPVITIMVNIIIIMVKANQQIIIKFNNFNNSNIFHKPFLECVGSGHAKLALRDDWQQALLTVKESIGFKRVRFHGLLDDDMGLVQSKTLLRNITTIKKNNDHNVKNYILNFTKIQQVFDFLIYEANVMPYIELSFMPGVLASGTTTYLHYKARTDPPKNYDDWRHVINSFGQFLVQRYGLLNISKLYFEVWNEPNLKNPLPHLVGEFWTGTQSEYYKLYETTSKALKNVSSKLQIGGPTTSGTPAWLLSFIKYCQNNSIPLDFISSHSYPSEVKVDSFIEAIQKSVDISKQINKTFFLSEFNDGLWFGCCHDRSYAASFLIRTAYALQNTNNNNVPGGGNDELKMMIDHQYLAGISYWTFSDIFEELYMDRDPFHNGYGLLTIDNIPSK